MEPQKRRLLYFSGALVVILGVLGAIVSQRPSKEIYTPGPGFYYTGVRLNPNTGQWVSGDNKIVPPPANATPAELADAKITLKRGGHKMMVPTK